MTKRNRSPDGKSQKERIKEITDQLEAGVTAVFDRLAENRIEDLKSFRERCGDDVADKLSPLIYDIDMANIIERQDIHCTWNPGDA